LIKNGDKEMEIEKNKAEYKMFSNWIEDWSRF